ADRTLAEGRTKRGRKRTTRGHTSPQGLCRPSLSAPCPPYTLAPWHFLYFRPDPHGQGSLRRTLDQSTLAGLLLSPNVRVRPAPTMVGALRGGWADAGSAAGAGAAPSAFCAGSGSSAGTSSRMPNALYRRAGGADPPCGPPPLGRGGCGGAGSGGENTSCARRNRSVNVLYTSFIKSTNIVYASFLYSMSGSVCPQPRYWMAARSWSRSYRWSFHFSSSTLSITIDSSCMPNSFRLLNFASNAAWPASRADCWASGIVSGLPSAPSSNCGTMRRYCRSSWKSHSSGFSTVAGAVSTRWSSARSIILSASPLSSSPPSMANDRSA